jgi:tetratricopeptide (TPR) repeat protein
MSGRLIFLSAAVAVIVIAAIFPLVANAWSLNLANVEIVRAVSLPPDAPQRASILNAAESRLKRVSPVGSNRLPLAETRILLARGDAQGAAQWFDRANAPLRADPIALFDWAQAAWESNQPDVAFARWRAADAYVYFAQQMHRAADSHAWKQAEDFARIAVGIAPDDADAHLVLGDALSRQDVNNPEAMRELERAQQLTSDHELLSTIISRQGEMLADQGKLQQALDYFDRARAVAPIDARPRTDAALVMLKLQPSARDRAVALLTQVVNDSPWYTAAYIALADLSESGGDAAGAEAWYRRGLARNENNPDLLFAEGEFYARQHRIDQARAALMLALKYETHVDNLQSIKRALAELGGQ